MKRMNRRKFLQVIGAASLVGAVGVLTGCDESSPVPGPEQDKGDGSVSLASLEAFNGHLKWNNGVEPEDVSGNSYSKAANYMVCVFSNEAEWDFLKEYTSNGYGYGFAEYRVSGKYKKLTMKLAPHKLMNKDGNAYIKVYADDKLVATSEFVKKKSSVIDFEANIAGAEYIKLEVYIHTGNCIGEGSDGDDGALIMADAKLWP